MKRFCPRFDSLESRLSLSTAPAPIAAIGPIALPQPVLVRWQVAPSSVPSALPIGDYVFVSPAAVPPPEVLAGATIYLTPYWMSPESPY